MKIITTFLLVICFISCKKTDDAPTASTYTPPPAVPGQWRKVVDNLPDSYIWLANSFVIGTRAYILDGNDFYKYDQANYKWTKKPAFPGDIRMMQTTAVAIGSKGYYGLGYSTGSPFEYRKDWWEYDPGTNQWTRKADVPLSSFSGAYAFAIGSKAYVGSGSNQRGERTNELYEYDPANNTWTKKASLIGEIRDISASFSINGKGYVGKNTTLEFYSYDAGTNTWTLKRQMPFQPTVSLSTATKGYIYGKGNLDVQSGKYTMDNFLYEYDPTSNNWVKKSDFNGPARTTKVAFAIGSNLYIGQGRFVANIYESLNINWIQDLWEYTP